MERPDLSNADFPALAYIEYLESELKRLHAGRPTPSRPESFEVTEPSEPPTTLNIVTISRGGRIKRTARHHYTRQRRGGMGVFDLDIPEDDPPVFLVNVDESQDLLYLTDYARAFRFPLKTLVESPIHDRGQMIPYPLPANEQLVSVVPAQNDGYLALLSQRGYVRLVRFNYLGESMRPGTPMLDVSRFGPLAAAAWVQAEDDIFVATRQGLAIRFRAKMVHTNGSLGIRLGRDDEVTGLTGVREDSGVLLVGSDGKGTIRLMAGFQSNKSPGAGGKIAIKTDELIGVAAVAESDDIFIISQLGKIIRFSAAEIPAKEGVVQGVNCIALRADQVVAITTGKPQAGG
jgi:DNA gyrase subunit A